MTAKKRSLGSCSWPELRVRRTLYPSRTRQGVRRGDLPKDELGMREKISNALQ